jgi:hypothetical protein
MKNHWLGQRRKKEISKRFLNEAKECSEKWAKLGLLEKLGCGQFMHAVLLEGQRLQNEPPSQEPTP